MWWKSLQSVGKIIFLHLQKSLKFFFFNTEGVQFLWTNSQKIWNEFDTQKQRWVEDSGTYFMQNSEEKEGCELLIRWHVNMKTQKLDTNYKI